MCPACTAQVGRTGRSPLFHTSLPLNHNRQWNLVCLQLLAQKARDRGVSPEKLPVSTPPVFSEQWAYRLETQILLIFVGDDNQC